MTSLRRRLMLGAALWTLGLLAVAVPTARMSQPVFDMFLMFHRHHPVVFLCAVLFMIGGLLVVRSAVAPLNELRGRLRDVRDGHADQLRGRYPSEVQPLVDDLNLLLAHTQQAVTRATAKAGDLAHGLKTPLAVLANEGEQLSGTGQRELAAVIAQQVERMQRQVTYHLAQARAAASGATPGARCNVRESVDALVRTLTRLYGDRRRTFTVDVDPGQHARCQREDLDEMLGNLLDNACKWAASRIDVSSRAQGESLAIVIEDDGRGIETEMRDAVLQRGVRADEASPGSGLGLAIVRDLAELYGGSITLDRSNLGGARATLTLPGS